MKCIRERREEKRREEERRSKKRKSPKKEDPGARKGRKVAKHCVSQMICGSGGSKSGLAKAAGCGASWPDERWKVAHRCGAKRISKSKCTNTPFVEHFWKLRCRKSAHRCGAKRISKSKCTKHTPLSEVEMSKKCRPLWREARFPSQNVQNTPCSDHFWKFRCRKSAHRCGAKRISKSKCTKHTMFRPLLEVEISKKLHTVCGAKHISKSKCTNTPLVEHFWKLRCRKSAHRCGAKRISKSKCTKHTPLSEVEMSKKCRPLWREARFQVKMCKTHHVRTTFGSSDVEKVHTVVARSTFRSQKWKKTEGTGHFWRLRCRFAWQAQGILHLAKSEQNWGFCSIYNYCHHYTPLHFTTLHYTQLHYTAITTTTTLNYTTPITLHYANYITLHYIIHYTTLAKNYSYDCTTLHSTPLRYTTLHSITLHYTTLHYTTLHYTTLATTTTTTLRYTTLITLHYTNYIALHYITLYYTSYNYNYNYNYRYNYNFS